jgi:hypothetical protein
VTGIINTRSDQTERTYISMVGDFFGGCFGVQAHFLFGLPIKIFRAQITNSPKQPCL